VDRLLLLLLLCCWPDLVCRLHEGAAMHGGTP
jgi:hypothetical protein